MKGKPKASRPYMPEYGIADAEGGKGLLPWDWARERLAASPYYWISTSSVEGVPHSMPVWAVFVDDRLYFSTGGQSRKSRNLKSNPLCAVSVQLGDDAVVLQGRAKKISNAALVKRLSRVYNSKYKMPLDPKLGPIFEVRPQKVFGLIGTTRGDCETSDFAATATRWEF